MSAQFTFHLLDSVDSTNNYAMEQIRAGLAQNGMAWQTRQQTAGRGQRGRAWHSSISDSILLSIALQPGAVFLSSPFLFNMAVSLVCRDFLAELCEADVAIKWPNDLYVNDRKAGGLLIENIYRGQTWQWAVVGIGINVNQHNFPIHAPKAVSLHQLVGRYFDPVALGRDLHLKMLAMLNNWNLNQEETSGRYHQHLYKINETVALATENNTISAQILGVDANGQLMTDAGIFRNGEVKFV